MSEEKVSPLQLHGRREVSVHKRSLVFTKAALLSVRFGAVYLPRGLGP